MRLVLFKYYNYLYPIVYVLNLVGFKINYLSISNFSIFKRKIDKDIIAEKLKKKNIKPLPIEQLPKIKTIQSFIHDINKDSLQNNLSSVPDDLINETLKFFGNIKSLKEKLRISLQKSFGEIYINYQSKIEIWSNNSDEKILIVLPLNGYFINFNNKKIKKLILPLGFIEFFFNAMSIFLRLICKKINFFKTKNNLDTPKNDKEKYKACFFYHHGRKYGNLYEKDIYFKKEKNSYLNKDNFLFIDYTNSLSNKENNEFNINDLISNKLKIFYKSLIFFFTLSNLIKNLKIFFSIIELTKIYYNYLKFENAINKFPNLLECYFANDITSPKEIFLVLEKLNIKSICHQDRFFISFCNTYPSNISDTYYCISSYIKNILIKSENYCPNNLIPKGFWKVDKSKNINKEMIIEINEKNFEKNITVLGHTTNSKWYDSQTNPYNSWSSQIDFLNDILFLSENYPNYKFILRFKDLEWLKISFFNKELNKINSKKNIEISRNYTMDNYSFFLCKQSDLVIGKYTSLIDECISIKIPCLIMDYNHQSKGIFSEVFDYGNRDIFCQSLNEINSKIKLANENKDFLKIDTHKYFSHQ